MKLYRRILMLFLALAICLNLSSCGVPYNLARSEPVTEKTERREQITETHESTTASETTAAGTPEVSKKLQVLFLNVGTGDCTFIKCGDVEILIDSGEKSGNADQFTTVDGLKDLVKEKCTDGKLEFVIATHGDADHIGIMSDFLDIFNEKKTRESGKPLKMQRYISGYTVGTIIDFVSEDNSKLFTTKTFKNYAESRDSLVKYTGTEYRPVSSFWAEGDEHVPVNILSDAGFNVYVLYNEYYFKKTSDSQYSNVLSVCVLLELGESKVLLTGDIQENDSSFSKIYGAESWLLQNNYEMLQNGVTLYKAAHHGSNTSNSEALLAVIQPKYIAISAIGTSKTTSGLWGFPKQSVLDTFLRYTRNITITAMDDPNLGTARFYGDVLYTLAADGSVEITCIRPSFGDGAIPLLTDTDWFKANRTVPADAVK